MLGERKRSSGNNRMKIEGVAIFNGRRNEESSESRSMWRVVTVKT